MGRALNSLTGNPHSGPQISPAWWPTAGTSQINQWLELDSVAISEDGKIPPAIQVECPNCRLATSIPLKYSEGSTIDYEGTCIGRLRASSGDFCKTSLIITVTLPGERDNDSQ